MNPSNQSQMDVRGIDEPQDQRPGVPMELTPEPMGNAHWLVPERQPPQDDVLKDIDHETLTATFGTEHPPHGLSGILRRAAYTIPDYYARRWLLLILADRVDAVELWVMGVFKRSNSN